MANSDKITKFEKLLKVARDIEGSPPGLPAQLLEAIPDGLCPLDVWDLVQGTKHSSDATPVLWAAYAILAAKPFDKKIFKRETGGLLIDEIASRIGRMMKPVCTYTSSDEDSTDYTSLSRNGLLGIRILNLLLTLPPSGGQVLPTTTLLSVIAFSNPNDPWSSSTCAQLSQSFLSDYFKNQLLQQDVKASPISPPLLVPDFRTEPVRPVKKITESAQTRFITGDVLTGFLRPIFAKSRPATVTASGRPAAFPEPPSRYLQSDGFGDHEKSWKYTQRYAVTVFEWAVKNADTKVLQKHWPFYTPILLTLLDEPQPLSLKLSSLSIFRTFWSRCPAGLLCRNGLVDVFEQAVFPTVLSLPSLTPETESLALLGAAYPALFDMAGVSVDEGESSDDDDATTYDPTTQCEDFSDAQRKMFDKIVKQGVMVGFHHAKNHIRLVDFLCQTLRRLVGGMGILSVKYLKDIIPMIEEILIDPFGPKYPSALLSATHLLQAVLQTCWPRVPQYYNEVIKIATLSWLNIEDEYHSTSPDTSPSKAELQQQLIRTIEMLSAVTAAAKLDLSDEIDLLVAKNENLRPLFASYDVK